MNPIFRFQFNLFTIFLFAVFTSSCRSVPKQEKTSVPSTVMFLSGDARSLKGDSIKPLNVGDIVEPGTVLQTAASGFYMVLSLGEEIGPPNRFGSGGIFDPEIHPANLLLLRTDSAVRLNEVTREISPKGKSVRDEVQLKLAVGAILGNVKTNSTYLIELTNGVFIMQPGTFWLDAAGNAKVFEGRGEIQLPSRGITNVLTAVQRFYVKTGQVDSSDKPWEENWRHNLWLPSDPMYVPWATPEGVKPESRYPTHPPAGRPF
jgi:hypothetical protein